MVNKKTTNTKKIDAFNTKNTRAMLLCCLFGTFGVHKFYQNKKGQGFIYLILSLTIIGILITSILSIIDIIKMTIKKDNSDKEFIVGLVLCLITPYNTSFNKITKIINPRYGKEIIKVSIDKNGNGTKEIYGIGTEFTNKN